MKVERNVAISEPLYHDNILLPSTLTITLSLFIHYQLHYVKQLKKGLLRLKLTGGLFDEQQQQVYAPQIVKMLNAMKTVGKVYGSIDRVIL